jgi:hypothetical protein
MDFDKNNIDKSRENTMMDFGDESTQHGSP